MLSRPRLYRTDGGRPQRGRESMAPATTAPHAHGPGRRQPMSIRKVALVTGSGKRRVGRAVAEALAGRGYAVALHYRTSAADAAAAVADLTGRGVEAAAFPGDLADETAAGALVRAAVER